MTARPTPDDGSSSTESPPHESLRVAQWIARRHPEWGHALVRLAAVMPWLVLVLWLVVWAPTFLGMMGKGRDPIDFLAYRRAADALGRGESPYPPPGRAQEIWRAFHRAEAELLEASARGRGPEAFRALLARPQQPGPYLYPPTLALLVAQLHLTAPAFAALTGLAIFGFVWL